jgi:TetR/AcrR family tetracycline transcriptional repressor
VVAAALDLIDSTGLENFSMRGLAQSLGVYPTALYWYVPNRNALLAEMVAVAMRDVLPPAGSRPWQSWLKALFRRYRRAVQRHPQLAAVMGAQMVSNAGVDPALPDRILTVLIGAGFGKAQLVPAFNSVIAAMTGFVTLEFGPPPAENNESWAKDFRTALRSVDARRYPMLAQTMPRLENRAFITRWQNGIEAPLDASFEAFIDMAVRGLEQRLKQDG